MGSWQAISCELLTFTELSFGNEWGKTGLVTDFFPFKLIWKSKAKAKTQLLAYRLRPCVPPQSQISGILGTVTRENDGQKYKNKT